MTTPAAAALYLAQNNLEMEGRKVAVFNPESRDLDQLPVIFGFNNGGSRGFLEGVLVSEDGTFLGSHACSDEAYMYHDLGILKGTRPDRHDKFQEHYPGGYRMEFVPYEVLKDHTGVNKALALLDEKEEEKGEPPSLSDEKG